MLWLLSVVYLETLRSSLDKGKEAILGIFAVVFVQSLSRVWIFVTPWTAACQASCPSPTPGACSNSCPLNPWCHPTISSSVVPFSAFNLSQHQGLFQWVSSSIRWLKYWSFSFSISPFNEYSGLISFRIDWFVLLAVQGLSRVFSNTTVQKHQFFSTQSSLWCSPHHIHTWLLEKT